MKARCLVDKPRDHHHSTYTGSHPRSSGASNRMIPGREFAHENHQDLWLLPLSRGDPSEEGVSAWFLSQRHPPSRGSYGVMCVEQQHGLCLQIIHQTCFRVTSLILRGYQSLLGDLVMYLFVITALVLSLLYRRRPNRSTSSLPLELPEDFAPSLDPSDIPATFHIPCDAPLPGFPGAHVC